MYRPGNVVVRVPGLFGAALALTLVGRWGPDVSGPVDERRINARIQSTDYCNAHMRTASAFTCIQYRAPHATRTSSLTLTAEYEYEYECEYECAVLPGQYVRYRFAYVYVYVYIWGAHHASRGADTEVLQHLGSRQLRSSLGGSQLESRDPLHLSTRTLVGVPRPRLLTSRPCALYNKFNPALHLYRTCAGCDLPSYREYRPRCCREPGLESGVWTREEVSHDH